MTQRTRLEKEAEYLTGLLDTPHTPNRGLIASRLRAIVEELTALDSGKHWTQPASETLQNIVADELAKSQKRM